MKKENRFTIFGNGFQPDYIREISNAMADKFDVIYLLGAGNQAMQDYKSNIKFFDLRGNSSPNRNIFRKILDLIRYYIRVINFIITNKIKFLFDPSIGKFWIIILFYSILKILNVKIILVVHNVLPHSNNNIISKYSYKYIYTNLTDHLIVHTKFLYSRLITEFNVSEKKITVANHGIYTVKDNPAISKNLAKQKLGYEEDDFILLIFGQQYPYKGTHLFIKEHFKFVADRAHLIIKGTGLQSYEDEIKEIIKQLDLEKFIKYEFIFVSDDERELLFKASDCVLIPYLEGSQSGVLFLAYSYGRPILANDIGSFKEDIIASQTGEIFKINDKHSFQTSFNKIFNNILQYDENKIKDFASKKYSWFTFSETTYELYRKIIF